MFSAKMAALCLCPALVATPAVIATHPKMRHAVAHFVHRAADRIDPPVIAAAEPIGHCPASYASEGPGGQGSSTPAGLTGLAPQDLSALQGAGAPIGGGYSGFGTGAGSFGSSPVSGIGGSGLAPPAPTGPDNGIVTTPTIPDGVTEPQNWALLVTGFAVTGMLLRGRRPKAAVAS